MRSSRLLLVIALIVLNARTLPATHREIAVSEPFLTTLQTGATPALASDGENYLAVFAHQSGIAYTRISREGEVLDRPARIHPISPTHGVWGGRVHVVWSGAHYLIIWSSERAIHVARVSREGLLIDQRTVFEGEPVHHIDVAFTGRETLVIYGWGMLFGAFLDVDGNLVRSGVMLVAGGSVYSSRLTFNGTNFIVTHMRDRELLSTAFDRDGRPLSQQVIARDIDTYPLPEIAAANGTTLVIAWMEGRLHAWRLAGVGELTRAVLLRAEPTRHANVEWGGEVFHVIHEAKAGTDSNLLNQRVSAAGDLLGLPIPVSNDPQLWSDMTPTLATSGANTLLLWTGTIGTFVKHETHLWATRLDASGAPLEGPESWRHITPMIEFVSQLAPRVAWTGTTYVAAWLENRGSPKREPKIDVWMSQVTRDGHIADGSGLPVSNVHTEEFRGASSVGIAFGSDVGLITYVEQWGYGVWALIGRRFNSSGEMLDHFVIVDPICGAREPQWDGDGFTIEYTMCGPGSERRLAKVFANGTVAKALPSNLPDVHLISSACNATGCLGITSTTDGASNFIVKAYRFTAAGVFLGESNIAAFPYGGKYSSVVAAVATSGETFFAAVARGGFPPVSARGFIIDNSGMVRREDVRLSGAVPLRAVWDGRSYVLIESEADLSAAWYSSNGDLIAPSRAIVRTPSHESFQQVIVRDLGEVTVAYTRAIPNTYTQRAFIQEIHPTTRRRGAER